MLYHNTSDIETVTASLRLTGIWAYSPKDHSLGQLGVSFPKDVTYREDSEFNLHLNG